MKVAQKIKLAKKRPQIGRSPKSKRAKRTGGLGEGIFALLRLRIERFRFSLIKRNTKQKKIASEKIKQCIENFSVLVPPKRSRAETHIIILDFAQKKFELHSENTVYFCPLIL